MVLATATAVAVSWLVAPELPAAIVPLMPRGLDCLDWTAAPGAFVRFVDYYGTAVFAQAGVVTAGAAGMNFLGCLVVGCITAMGGGSFRGFVLGEQVFWAQEPEYVYISLAASVLTFFFWPGVERLFAKAGKSDVLERSLNWLDALAIAGFCVIGANNGLRAAAGDPVVAVACGMFTGRRRDSRHALRDAGADIALAPGGVRVLHQHRRRDVRHVVRAEREPVGEVSRADGGRGGAAVVGVVQGSPFADVRDPRRVSDRDGCG